MQDLALDLLIDVVDQMKSDAVHGDFTAIEELFLHLDDPESRLRAYLTEEGED